MQTPRPWPTGVSAGRLSGMSVEGAAVGAAKRDSIADFWRPMPFLVIGLQKESVHAARLWPRTRDDARKPATTMMLATGIGRTLRVVPRTTALPGARREICGDRCPKVRVHLRVLAPPPITRSRW